MIHKRMLAALAALLVLLPGAPAHAASWRWITTPLLKQTWHLTDFASDGRNVWLVGGQGYYCRWTWRFCILEDPGVDVVLRYEGAKWVKYPVEDRAEHTYGERVIDTVEAYEGEVWIQDDLGDGYLARFDGSAFTRVDQPVAGRGNLLMDVGPAGVWMANGGTLHRRTGETWTQTPLPPDVRAVYDVEARSATDAWLVGGLSNGPFAARWDGTSWTQVPLPAWAKHIKMGAGDEVWAYDDNSSRLLHWDGVGWNIIEPHLNAVRDIGLDASGVPWVLHGGRPYRYVNGVPTPVKDFLLDRFDLEILAVQGDSIWSLGTGPFGGYSVLTDG